MQDPREPIQAVAHGNVDGLPENPVFLLRICNHLDTIDEKFTAKKNEKEYRSVKKNTKIDLSACLCVAATDVEDRGILRACHGPSHLNIFNEKKYSFLVLYRKKRTQKKNCDEIKTGNN